MSFFPRFRFNLAAPDVTPFVECPNCRRLLRSGISFCPDCREEITEEYAAVSAAVNRFNTQACSTANAIRSGNALLVILSFASAWSFYLSDPALFLGNTATSVIAVSVVAMWLRKYGGFQAGDDEFVLAKREMWGSLKLWLAFVLMQVLVLMYMLKS